MLGDVVNTDQGYTGADGSSPLTLDYYRNVVTDFQHTLEALDAAAQSASASIDSAPDDVAQQLSDLVTEYNGKKGLLWDAAQAINAVASASNAMGLRFPVLSIPQSLGIAPVVAIAGAAAAVAAAAALIVWGKDWIARVYAAQQQAIAGNLALQAAENITDPATRDAALADLATKNQQLVTQAGATQAALSTASGGVVGQVASTVKWVAILALGYFGFRVWEQYGKKGH